MEIRAARKISSVEGKMLIVKYYTKFLKFVSLQYFHDF